MMSLPQAHMHRSPPRQPRALLKMPYYLSPGWLRIDPTFGPLKGNARFEPLVVGK